jgi:hypothetical protein
MNKQPKLVSRLIEVSGFLMTALFVIIMAPSILVYWHLRAGYPGYAAIAGVTSLVIVMLVALILLVRLLDTDRLERRISALETDVDFTGSMLGAENIHELNRHLEAVLLALKLFPKNPRRR